MTVHSSESKVWLTLNKKVQVGNDQENAQSLSRMTLFHNNLLPILTGNHMDILRNDTRLSHLHLIQSLWRFVSVFIFRKNNYHCFMYIQIRYRILSLWEQ